MEHAGAAKAGRRIAPRFPADLPYRLYAGGQELARGTLIDLSMLGAALQAEGPLPRDAAVLLHLADPGGAWVLDLPARVVASEPDPLGGVVVRLRFELEFERARGLAWLVTLLRSEFNSAQAAIAAERLGMYGRAYLARDGR